MTTLAHKRWGRGEVPLLLLHGFTGDSSSFDHLESHLGDLVRALAVDLPGHGASAPTSVTGREGFLATVDALASLIGDGATDVLGYSQGARLALALAVRHPSRVRRLVLESGSPGLRSRKARNARRDRDEALATSLLRDGTHAFATRWEALPMFEGLRRLPDPLAAELSARRRSQSAEGLASALRALGTGAQPDLWPSLHRVRVPVLLLTGERDTKFTEIARRMCADLPVSWRHAFPDCFHAPHLEAHERYAEEVRSFLQTPWYEAEVALHDPSLRSNA